MRTGRVAFVILLAGLHPCAAGALTGTDWPTYAYDSVRSGNNSAESVLTPDTVSQLRPLWSFEPGKFDAAQTPPMLAGGAQLRNQAIVASGVSVQGVPHDLVMFGDNNGSFFALDARTGAIAW